ncbi:MAG: hypothetical protein E4H40_02670, partial [Candidatus Brocadiia bacterium]
MNNTTSGYKTAIYLLILLVCGLFIPSCKKAPQQASPEPQGTQGTSDTNESNNKQTPDASKAKMVPIDIKLPKAMFVGTPANISGVTNLMKPLGKPRPLFLAPEGTTNVAFGKKVTSSYEEPIIGKLDLVTDGDKEAIEGSYV